MNTLTPSRYFAAINAATLQGFDHLADALLCLYLFDHPNGPRPASKAPVRNPVQAKRQAMKDSHNPFGHYVPESGPESP